MPTQPSVSLKSVKKVAKSCKKGVDIPVGEWYYIQVAEIQKQKQRHRNEQSDEHEPWKLNNNLLKSECAGRALSKRETKSN